MNIGDLAKKGYKKIKRILVWNFSNLFVLMKYRFRKKQIGINQTEKRDKKIVVSLTSIPTRLKSLSITIDLIMRQTIMPDFIVLYLDEKQFENIQLPKQFDEFKSRGLTIKYVEDIRPHTKYFYAMKYFPNDIIITIDDDIAYKSTLIEMLMNSYKKYPNEVSCMRAHKILFDNNKQILPYNEWEYESKYTYEPSMFLFATGVGGVLYPPHCMDDELFNIDKLKEISIFNDDVWLKAMQIIKKTSVVLVSVKGNYKCEINGSQKIALSKINVRNNRNDIIIKKVFDEYNITYDNFVLY